MVEPVLVDLRMGRPQHHRSRQLGLALVAMVALADRSWHAHRPRRLTVVPSRHSTGLGL